MGWCHQPATFATAPARFCLALQQESPWVLEGSKPRFVSLAPQTWLGKKKTSESEHIDFFIYIYIYIYIIYIYIHNIFIYIYIHYIYIHNIYIYMYIIYIYIYIHRAAKLFSSFARLCSASVFRPHSSPSLVTGHVTSSRTIMENPSSKRRSFWNLDSDGSMINMPPLNLGLGHSTKGYSRVWKRILALKWMCYNCRKEFCRENTNQMGSVDSPSLIQSLTMCMCFKHVQPP